MYFGLLIKCFWISIRLIILCMMKKFILVKIMKMCMYLLRRRVSENFVVFYICFFFFIYVCVDIWKGCFVFICWIFVIFMFDFFECIVWGYRDGFFDFKFEKNGYFELLVVDVDWDFSVLVEKWEKRKVVYYYKVKK